jgi:hypothetical protein
MAADKYDFVTRWRLRGRCEDVADALEDTEGMARWWPSLYRRCTILEPGGRHGLGRRVEVLTKGFLPYTIHWRYTVVEESYPHGSRIVADGDLAGEGRWTLVQRGDVVDVTYQWSVRANHPLLRRLSRVLRPLFAANHDWTMRQGLRGLRRELATRLQSG